jgi:hypothetical protein
MTAILSVTDHEFYSFPLAFTIFSWNKIGIKCAIFAPEDCDKTRIYTGLSHLPEENLSLHWFKAPQHKIPTYAQVSRLFGCCLQIPDDEILITGDADLCVFGDYLLQANDGKIHVFGNDLVAGDQLPMCFLAAPKFIWKSLMWAPDGFGYQFYLDELLGPIECEHFKANQWCFDQNLAHKNFTQSGLPIVYHPRAKSPHQFATRRADRDGWPNQIPIDIVDAHLPRSGHTDENFAKILNLFQTIYPEDNFQWMIDYRNEYVKLIN